MNAGAGGGDDETYRISSFFFILDYLDVAKIQGEQNLERKDLVLGFTPIVESTSSVGLLQGD